MKSVMSKKENKIESQERGFTLIEMMISLAMGLLILAGITSTFTSMSKTSSAVSSRTEGMSDLFLISHIMQEELRFSLKQPDANKSVLTDLTGRAVTISNYPSTDAVFVTLPYWDAASKTLTYQNQDGDVGVFHYQHAGEVDRIYWLRADPTISTFDELTRSMATTNGLCVLDAADACVGGTTNQAGVSSIGLNAVYAGEDHSIRNMSLSFRVWPRN